MLDAADQAAYEAESQDLRLALKTWETTWAREHGGAKPGRGDIKQNADIAQKYTAYNRLRGILSGKIPAAPDAKKDETRRKRKHAPTSSTVTAAVDSDTHNPHVQTPSKRLRATVTRATPSRAAAATSTPGCGGGGYLDAIHLSMTPSISRKLFSPIVPTSIGPTPQRDGHVLGLFDVLNDEEEKRKKRSAVEATPSKQTAAETATAGGQQTAQTSGHVSVNVLGATPRKQTLNMEGYRSDDGNDNDDDDDDDNAVNARRLGRTPMSSGRRNLLNHFTAGGGGGPTIGTRGGSGVFGALGTTPLKARDANIQQPQQRQLLLTTPSKGNGLQQAFATPAFLRRQSAVLPPVDENGAFLSPPGKLRLPRKPLVRGLSSVLASLRRMEDEHLDDQLDVLRDLEDGMDVNTRPPPKAKAAQLGKPLLAVSLSNNGHTGLQIEDSQLQVQAQAHAQAEELDLQNDLSQQPPRLLGGFDDEGLYDSAPEDQVGRDGQPLRVYKKKGQKRTTRRSNMRPTRTKRPAAGTMAESENDSEGEDEGGEGGETLVPETQVAGGSNDDLAALSGSEFGSDAEGDDATGRKAASKAKKAKKANADKKTAKAAKAAKAAGDGKEGPVKKAVRKVNELAHANFKRLKLRNKGSKGGPGFNSRFRRKR